MYIGEKIFMKIQSVFFQSCEPNYGKMPYLTMLRNTSKILCPDLDFQKFNNFFLVYRYICGKIFAMIGLVDST